MIELSVVQRSPEWFKARCGIPTSSGFDKILTTKGERSKQAEKYMYQLAVERITGIKRESYQNFEMQQGIEREPEARSFYELVKNCKIKEAGICYLDKRKRFSASPDGFVGSDGLIEIKCPIDSTQVSYLLNGGLETDYFQQAQGQLFITGRKWCDLISYFPGIKPLIIRVKQDKEFIKKLEKALYWFCAELDRVVAKIK